MVISKTGIKMGISENQSGGRFFGSSTDNFLISSRGASIESRSGMGHLELAQTAYKYPVIMVMNPTRMPPIIIMPRGIFISLTKNRGPGVGGTRELAMAAAAVIQRMSSRSFLPILIAIALASGIIR